MKQTNIIIKSIQQSLAKFNKVELKLSVIKTQITVISDSFDKLDKLVKLKLVKDAKAPINKWEIQIIRY